MEKISVININLNTVAAVFGNEGCFKVTTVARYVGICGNDSLFKLITTLSYVSKTEHVLFSLTKMNNKGSVECYKLIDLEDELSISHNLVVEAVNENIEMYVSMAKIKAY